jgi:hypothetical protein
MAKTSVDGGMAELLKRQRDVRNLLSANLCRDALNTLKGLTDTVRDLRKNSVPVGSLKGEYAKLGTALGVSRTTTVKVASSRPNSKERAAAIIVAFAERNVPNKLEKGLYPKTSIVMGANACLTNFNPKFDQLTAAEVNPVINSTCITVAALTADDKKIAPGGRGKEVKTKLMKPLTTAAEIAKAKTILKQYKERIKNME